MAARGRRRRPGAADVSHRRGVRRAGHEPARGARPRRVDPAGLRGAAQAAHLCGAAADGDHDVWLPDRSRSMTSTNVAMGLTIAALVFFLFAAFPTLTESRVQWQWLALACLVAALLMGKRL